MAWKQTKIYHTINGVETEIVATVSAIAEFDDYESLYFIIEGPTVNWPIEIGDDFEKYTYRDLRLAFGDEEAEKIEAAILFSIETGDFI